MTFDCHFEDPKPVLLRNSKLLCSLKITKELEWGSYLFFRLKKKVGNNLLQS